MSKLSSVMLVFTYLIGTSIILIPVSGISEQDMWISGLLAWTIGLGFAFVLSLCKPLKGRHLIARLIFAAYSIFLAVLVTRNLGEITGLTLLPSTPQIVCNTILVFIAAYATFQGKDILGHLSIIMAAPFIISQLIILAMSMSVMNPEQLLPVFDHSPGLILKSAFPFTSFPFMELIVLFPLLGNVINPAKALLPGTLLAGAILLITIVIITTVLPLSEIQNIALPFFNVSKSIPQGNYIGLPLVMVWILTGFMKLAIIHNVAVCELKAAFNIKKTGYINIFVTLAIISFSILIFNNTIQMSNFAFKGYPYIAMPIQIGLLIYFLIVGRLSGNSKPAQN